jgi:hypothetical protein
LLGVPLWEALGLDEPHGLRSSFSIGLDRTEVMARKLVERADWAAYKVKLAHPHDLHVLEELRRHTNAPFYVDGNCGWELSVTVPALGAMRDLGVELLEQPFPRDAWADARLLKRLSPIPVIADESIVSRSDLNACAEAFHGINVKPMKAGGLIPAVNLLRDARRRGLVTMLGCMPESAAGVSATAHLGALADHVDVDAVELMEVDTGHGVRLDHAGWIVLPDRPGSGYLPDPVAGGWRVRAVEAEDVPPLQQGMPGPPQSAPPHDHRWTDPGPDVQHFAALSRGRPVGSVRVHPEDPPAGRFSAPAGRAWRMHGPVTLDEARGTGADTALVRVGLTHAVLAGAALVWCCAPAAVAGSYRHYGFHESCPFSDRPETESPVFMYWSAR